MTISVSDGSLDIITAGRSFLLVKSVKGKGTRTISPRLSRVFSMESDFFSILQGVNVLTGIVQEFVAISLLRYLSDNRRG